MVKEDKTSKLIVATGKVIEIADYSREAMRLHIESNMKRYIVREMNNDIQFYNGKAGVLLRLYEAETSEAKKEDIAKEIFKNLYHVVDSFLTIEKNIEIKVLEKDDWLITEFSSLFEN